MKKLTGTILCGLSLAALASCGGGSSSSADPVRLDAPNVSIDGNTISWDAVTGAKEYVVKINDTEYTQTETTYQLPKTGKITYSVKAVSSNVKKYYSSKFSVEAEYEFKMTATTVWIVGDSTGCDYAKYDDEGKITGITDPTYFYDRFGYGTQLYNYFDDAVTVRNIALSGRSSKSFTTEVNYKILKEEMKAGDYLVISFGHNDEKKADTARYADASKSTDTEGSFKYNLYNDYIKVAQDKGANPILTTPISRLNKNMTGHNVHDYTDEGSGNYANAIKELGVEKSVPVVDLTQATADLYTRLGYDEAVWFHAMSAGLSDNEADITSVDTTHINIYGAKMVSYMFADLLKGTTCDLKDYVKADIVAPTKANDLVKNSLYKYIPYAAANVANAKSYIDDNELANFGYDDNFVGTAFGDCGGEPMSAGNGYVANVTAPGVYKVGQGKSTGSTTYKGKIASTAEGIAFMYRQVSINDNFKMSCDVKVLSVDSGSLPQGGFGLMLRDATWSLGQYTSTNVKSLGQDNSYCAGFTTTTGKVQVVYARRSGTIIYADTEAEDNVGGVISSANYYAAGDTAKCTIERIGQEVTCTVIYKGETYSVTYHDVDLVAKDKNYMYVGFYGARGTIAEFSNVTYEYKGVSEGA